MAVCKLPNTAKAGRLTAWQARTWLSGWLGGMEGCIDGLSRRLLLLMLHSFGQYIHLAFQQLALVGVALAQVVPLEALVICVEVVRDAAIAANMSGAGALGSH